MNLCIYKQLLSKKDQIEQDLFHLWSNERGYAYSRQFMFNVHAYVLTEQAYIEHFEYLDRVSKE